MEIIIILTYDCNFRCTYCDIHKRKEDMVSDIFQKSLMFLNESKYEIKKMKFFGGEPLLRQSQIKDAVTKLWEKVENFYVTTNASLLSRDFVEFAQNNNLHITVSIDGDRETTERNRKTLSGKSLYDISLKNTLDHAHDLRVNQVITSDTAHCMFENFVYLYNCWFRQFNFLPEYYREWSKEWLKNLIRGFDQIYHFSLLNSIYLVNTENYSATSFFNLWIVIDTDGSLYGTNLMLSWDFEKYKSILKIWHISTGVEKDIFDSETISQYTHLVESLLAKEYSYSILNSVKYIDRILSNFVHVYSGK